MARSCSCSCFDSSLSLLVALSLLRDTQLAVSGVALFEVFVLSIISRRAAISACHLRMSWRNGKSAGAGNYLAQHVLRSLFEFSPDRNGAQKKPEWRCKECGTTNFMDRAICRRCGTVHVKPTKSNGPKTHQPKQNVNLVPAKTKVAALAPWATPEMVQDREDKLSIAISAARASGGCEDVITSLEKHLTSQQKKNGAPVSVLAQIDSTKGFIGRCEKRLSTVEAQIADLRTESAKMKQEMAGAEDRLKRLEVEAADLLHLKPPVEADSSLNAFKTLEDAVRTLMIAMHASRQQLPLQVAEVVEVVATCLPTPPPSKDYEGENTNHEKRSHESDEDEDEDDLMAELDEEDSEAKLLEIARRLKAKRLKVQ